MTSTRRHERYPASLAVSYRTTGSFLIAYTVNLSKGGMFIEAEPLPVGSPIELRLALPGAAVTIEAVVSWVRPAADATGPSGMGLEFSHDVDQVLGGFIDQLASTFEGIEILVMGDSERRSLLVRNIRHVLSCDCIEADTPNAAEAMLVEGVDLVVVDLDSTGAGGMEMIRRSLAATPPPPVIAVAADRETCEWAQRRGVDQVLKAPPVFAELQMAVLKALSRPLVK